MKHRAFRAVLALAAGVSAIGVARADAATIVIETVSNRADLISAGDALVEVTLDGVALDDVAFELNGVDVTSAFVLRENGRIMAQVTGLQVGPNVLRAISPSGGAELTITNHPIEGPVFSGPHITPWLCTTAAAGLGPNTPPACNAPTRVDYFYQATGSSSFSAYNPNSPPTNVRMITTDHGETVPYIIKQETGSMDRGIYRLAVLYNPAQPDWKPWKPYRGWNGKLYYPFGASCGTVYSQSSAQNVQNSTALSRGFMVATSSLNVLGNNCNTVLSAEAMMMLKEHIVDNYGEIRYTFGNGSSGGSIGQNMVANSYPGLLQGITEGANYADTITTGMEVFDCHVLLHYFLRFPALWNPAQQAIVTGNGTSPGTCAGWEVLFSAVMDPRNGCGVPANEHYHPTNNPGGCRGSYNDFERNVWGLRPPAIWTAPEKAIGRGFARRLYDNIGVQFGLTALRDGLITTEQFVHMNENVGGFDVDFNLTRERAEADEHVARITWESGRVVDGRFLAEVPMIDSRPTGNVDPLLIHTMHHSFALKERIRKFHGHANNHVVWRGSAPADAFNTMDAWLSAIEADTAPGTLADKVARNRPAAATDSCSTPVGRSYDKSTCDTFWPYHSAPRVVAGQSMTHDNTKCQTKPLDRSDPDYGIVPFTDLQWERLVAVFGETGVCDWSKPPVGHQPTEPWMTYADGPGLGRPLGPPPASIAI